MNTSIPEDLETALAVYKYPSANPPDDIRLVRCKQGPNEGRWFWVSDSNSKAYRFADGKPSLKGATPPAKRPRTEETTPQAYPIPNVTTPRNSPPKPAQPAPSQGNTSKLVLELFTKRFDSLEEEVRALHKSFCVKMDESTETMQHVSGKHAEAVVDTVDLGTMNQTNTIMEELKRMDDKRLDEWNAVMQLLERLTARMERIEKTIEPKKDTTRSLDTVPKRRVKSASLSTTTEERKKPVMTVTKWTDAKAPHANEKKKKTSKVITIPNTPPEKNDSPRTADSEDLWSHEPKKGDDGAVLTKQKKKD